MSAPVPELRVRTLEARPLAEGGRYVLYWMVAQRRTRHNFGLQRAAWHARRLARPLLIFEPLALDHPHACERFHHFVLDGMADNAARLRRLGVRYLPYIERAPGEARGLLEALASRACVVVSDEVPAASAGAVATPPADDPGDMRFIARLQQAAAARLELPVELVDSNGILPLAASDRAFPTAHSFRRFVHAQIGEHLTAMPLADPLAALERGSKARLPAGVGRRWTFVSEAELGDRRGFLSKLALDHEVRRSPVRGGARAATEGLRRFLEAKLDRYAEDRNHPDEDVQSGLSPHLHFGHVGAHEVVAAVLEREGWDPSRLGDPRETRGSRRGFWGVSEAAEAFLDQVLTWRELGQHFCWHTPDYASYGSLPSWARETLDEHRDDPRPELATLEELEFAQTGDPLWNAAQRQLRVEGRTHNYLRMLWGKRILEWSPTPERALTQMLLLNDKYALDGRDPNSVSGIAWVLGRFDRAWGPERPIFGKVRYMSSANARRKLKLDGYLARWSAID